MATYKQEEIYNEIMKYYDLIDKLVGIADNFSSTNSDKYFAIIEESVAKFEESADKLSDYFINFVRNGFSGEISQNFEITFRDLELNIQKTKQAIENIKNE